MLGKLIKHDIISTGRIMGIIYAIVAGISAVILISHYANKGQMTVGQSLGVVALFLISMCMFILTTVIVLTDFQKSLYGDRGYLTFTLPVKSQSILASKLIVSTLWYVVALAAFFGSIYTFIVVIKNEVVSNEYGALVDMFSMYTGITWYSLTALITINIIKYFIMFAYFTMAVFFAISIANTRRFQQHYLLWTIIFAIPIVGITYKIGSLIEKNIVFSVGIVNNTIKFVASNSAYQSIIALNGKTVDISSIFIYAAFGIGLFFATHYIMSKKVNIK